MWCNEECWIQIHTKMGLNSGSAIDYSNVYGKVNVSENIFLYI